MAMLAEPRRKQKWSVDPRNSAWSKDESKFGQKMLEKMGWSKGKGLGAQEQGNTEHIKVQVKNNTLGLGASINQEDNWIAHQDDFNQLLAELNSCHGQDTPDTSSQEEKRKFSLEEKSKTSRKRVHYVKFAKGKDLSSRSEDDLSCIFGKRQVKNAQASVTATDSPEEDLEEEEKTSDAADTSNTVTSALTVQEYFAERMAKLKKAQPERAASPPPRKKVKSMHLGSQTSKEKGPSRHDPAGPEINCPHVLGTGGEAAAQQLDSQKRKKKKSKSEALNGDVSYSQSQNGIQGEEVCNDGASDAENDGSEEPRQKKKNKKKHKKLKKETMEGVDSTKSKKKKYSS
uniref:PIN2 (TERF1) interacting telomerase inhibitor 1 n=1 Tax=Salvator merianae TaxID=96440 RepID=A0A8D0C1B8_SALMN